MLVPVISSQTKLIENMLVEKQELKNLDENLKENLTLQNR